jgi:putative chitinase
MDINLLKGSIPDEVILQIPEMQSKFNIDTPVELAHFLAQCAHESGGFKLTVENLNYSEEGLMRVFRKYFPSDTTASLYAKKPEKIANKVYSNRMGNGNELSGDGWKYRGRGYIQITGKSNYAEFDKYVPEDIVNNPELVATKYPLVSAAWFFSKNCLKKCVDSSDQTVTTITKCINGGTNGLIDRLKYFKKYYQLLANG